METSFLIRNPPTNIIQLLAGFQFAPYLADLMFQLICFGLWQDSYFSKESGMALFYLK